tara:strand:- start:525 stop:710 length:186 start_codon:yes stop_codon:yes gene_type:complete
MKKIMREKTLHEIRTFSDDQSSMKGDPLEDIGKLLVFIMVVFGLGITALAIKGIIWIINNI